MSFKCSEVFVWFHVPYFKDHGNTRIRVGCEQDLQLLPRPSLNALLIVECRTSAATSSGHFSCRERKNGKTSLTSQSDESALVITCLVSLYPTTCWRVVSKCNGEESYSQQSLILYSNQQLYYIKYYIDWFSQTTDQVF